MLEKLIKQNLCYISLTVAIVSTLVSLYASDVLKLPPCNLCWYQRIAMYPLIPIIIVGILKKDKNLPYYVLPLSIMGMAFALYHHLLQIGVISETLAPCAFGVSCTTKYLDLFGLVTFPLLSFLAFTLITLAMVAHLRYNIKP